MTTMTDDLRTRIAAVVVQHHTGEDYDCKWPLQCECDAKWRSPEEWARHVADAVIRELGLHPVETLDRRYVRHCTKWRDNPDWKGGE